MYKIAVVGDRDSTLGFKALGLDTVFADSPEEARGAIHRLAAEDCAVIYLTEQLAQSLTPELDRYTNAQRPAIILIPGKAGSLGIGIENINKAVEKAVGSNILKNE
ncbi:MAG: V-type ATP synthase subunit F [Peptococcaceae bacterium]|jgi:V/A-type H+-transporting ATPase subunit F|nr:V-type ATP synthase subunit F [Peptococcaceae bacterium]